jgi:hypothetical protein
MGLPKKCDVLSNSECMDWVVSEQVLESKPVWSIAPKTEWYPAEKIDDDKVRTVIIPPFHLFFWQSVLYKEQHEALKEFWWSAYGFNPYQGGVSRLVQSLTANGANVFGVWDVKKWDRLLPLLGEIHEFRRTFVSDEFLSFADWATRNTVTSYILTPGGLILWKEIGNNSGSGSTTPDNIIAHMYIIYLLFLKIYDGDTDRARNASAKLFGDDAICSVRTSLTIDQLNQTTREVYGLFGLLLDPLTWQTSVEGLEFLGFTIVQINGEWVPRYSLGRIAASFAYVIETIDSVASITKAWTLMVMTAGCGEKVYERYADAVSWMLYKIGLNLELRDDPVISSYCALGVPSFASVMNFYTGKEGPSTVLVDYSVLNSCCMEVGGIYF